jgi:hypothetical protein
MFVADEIVLDLSFRGATARLSNLTHGGSLASAAEGAYGDGLQVLIRVGPLGAIPGVSKLVLVHFRDMILRDDRAVLTLRWEATGAGGGMFPALDADITLTPAGNQATRLALAGAYRPPLAGLGTGLDRAILHRMATATARSFMGRIGDALTQPGTAAETAPGSAAKVVSPESGWRLATPDPS